MKSLVLLILLFLLVPRLLPNGGSTHWNILPGWTSSPPGLSEEKQVDLFVSGTRGYHTFRIPSLLVTRSGALLAFCEGRKNARSDTGDIDLILRRSEDGGRTWGDLEVIADDGDHVMGNPCPVLDRETGTVWLLLTRNLGQDTEKEIMNGTSLGTRECWVMGSTDDGRTWSPPRNITADTKADDWTWYATGPGIGIQLRSGRLLIPCDHAVAGSKMFRSHVVLSDDHGKTWRLGGVAGDLTNECQAVQREDGSVLLNMRSYHGKNRRYVSVSSDGGETWTDPVIDEELVEPVCQASLIRFQAANRNLLLFSNPAAKKRVRMTVKMSRDEGDSWPVSRTIYSGPSAYSCLADLGNGEIGLLYERGKEHPYEKITFARFPASWLEEK